VPFYDETKINAELHIIMGSEDLNCNIDSGRVFENKVNNANGNNNIRTYEIEGWNHYSFIVPKDVKPLYEVFDKILY